MFGHCFPPRRARFLRGLPASSLDARPRLCGSSRNGERSGPARGRPRNGSRIGPSKFGSSVAMFSWTHDRSKRRIIASGKIVQPEQLQNVVECSYEVRMKVNFCKNFLEIIEHEAVKIYPPDSREGEFPFNMTHFLLASGFKQSNKKKWTRLKKNPHLLKLAEAYRFASAVGWPFVEVFVFLIILSF